MDSPESVKQANSFLGGRQYHLTSGGGSVESLSGDRVRLSIPGGPGRTYRLAQIYDTKDLPRRDFNWQVPFSLNLKARVSAADLPGTWGFGLWNDPFSASMRVAGGGRKLPALPNAVWFFHASPENYLSLRDDLPGSGFLSAVFSSPLTSSIVLSPAVLFLPLLAWKPAARMARRFASAWIKEDSTVLSLDQTMWHEYRIAATTEGVEFLVDGKIIFSSTLKPRGHLGLVVWIDNQYAAFTPEGRFGYGTLALAQPAWLEIEGLAIQNTL